MKSERGQALILIALAMIAMLGLTALAIDGGMAFAERRSAQNAADNAALSAAYSLAAGGTKAQAEAAAATIANGNGYTDVTINIPPLSGPYQGNGEYVEVIINSTTDTVFASLIGVEEVASTTGAVARGRPQQAGTLAHGNAIIALKETGKSTMLYNGGANVTVTGGSGMFVNSNDADALFFNSNITVSSPGMTVVGGYKTNASFPWLSAIKTGQTSQKIPLPPVSLTGKIPAIPAAPTCSTNGTYSTSGNVTTFTPGKHNSIIVDSGKTAKFKPGVYCLNGNFNINGSGIVSGEPGAIKFVLSQSLNLGGGPHTFDNVEFYSTNASLVLQNKGDTLTANRIRFYATGSGQVIVNANATFKADDAFFYFGTSDFKWNGNSTIKLKAPPVGDPFAGLLIYMPYTNTTSVEINGGSTVDITGTIMIPHADLTINGGANMNAVNSQIIAYTTKFNGGGQTNVEFNADENYSPAEPPIVELAQ
ncbi:MAG: hypothetical protein CVU44_08975 [Chloroflexi bacterium HGW-Chloroflexi-6]|nr:MAG: hypothetical protein CVU44_08975 [Chloroflexi bacterium HGW-Chloroflexi-6]